MGGDLAVEKLLSEDAGQRRSIIGRKHPPLCVKNHMQRTMRARYLPLINDVLIVRYQRQTIIVRVKPSVHCHMPTCRA